MNAFNEVKKNFGFGCMRLKMTKDKVDMKEFNKMVDYFIDNGFNYFDTAHVYLNGQSELALKEGLVKRYPRDKYLIADKLSSSNFEKEEDLESLFQNQLECVGVDYFDFYLMHAQDRNKYEKYTKTHAYEFGLKKKQEGRIKHLGISFHDSADILEKILKDHPEIEFVQIQFNYADFDNPVVQSKKCYDVCVKYNKPVIVMEPVRGGDLVNLPKSADKIFKELKGGSNASYAIRFAASYENVFMVLSGMSNFEQMKDNLSYMKEFVPINEKERNAIAKVVAIYNNLDIIQCTSCRYCVSGCPKNIPIPDIFTCLNAKIAFNERSAPYYYDNHTKDKGKAKDCIKCGKCEQICPQKIQIRHYLEVASKNFDN